MLEAIKIYREIHGETFPEVHFPEVKRAVDEMKQRLGL